MTETLMRYKNPVVIRDLDPLEFDLGVSEFGVVHFDGPDAYWVNSELGGMREYFRRAP